MSMQHALGHDLNEFGRIGQAHRIKYRKRNLLHHPQRACGVVQNPLNQFKHGDAPSWW